MIKGFDDIDKIYDRVYNLDDVDYSKPMYFNDIWTDLLKMVYNANLEENIFDTLPKSIERTLMDIGYSINYINRCSGEKELGVIRRNLLVRLETIKDDIYNNIRSIKYLDSISNPKLLIYLMFVWEGVSALRETHYMFKSVIERIERRNNK